MEFASPAESFHSGIGPPEPACALEPHRMAETNPTLCGPDQAGGGVGWSCTGRNAVAQASEISPVATSIAPRGRLPSA